MLTLNPKMYGSVFVMPTDIVDQYIKLASPAALKALLWILRNRTGDFSVAEIARHTGYSAADITDAVDYWLNEGVLCRDGSVPDSEKAVPAAAEATLPAEPPEKPAPAPKLPEVKIARPTLEQLNARMAENDEITFLMQEAQSILGRTFGFDMQSTLLMFYDTYGLKLEVILTLLQFCVQQQRASTAYIAKLGKTWAEKEINTLREADEFIENSLNANQIFAELKALTGISTPRPTAVQTDYIASWNRLGFNAEMMALAFEETADRTGKISFNYMNKILQNWNAQGYRSPADVENGKQKFKEQKAVSGDEKRSYDIDTAFNQTNYKPPKYVKKEREQT